MISFTDSRKRLVGELRKKGWKIAKDAMDPLQRIDFSKLVKIYDHEEYFLEETFIRILLALLSSRAPPISGDEKVSAEDVETALLMLGTAIPRQRDETLSKESKSVIIDSCGFCSIQRNTT